MHSNVHFAMGVVIGSAALYFFPTDSYLDLIYLIIIILAAIMADLDVFAAKYAHDGDHRNFFTHSIYPGIALLIFGIPIAIFLNIHVIWFSALSYGSHIFLDTIDWKTRLFYGKKQYGFAYLITEDERNFGKTKQILMKESGMGRASFLVHRYFKSMGMVTVGIILAIVSFLLLFLVVNEYWYVFIGYFGLLEIHLYQKKKMERNYDNYNEEDEI